MPLLSAALGYASADWHVFPLDDDSKVPISAHGHLDATTDEDQIRRWWTDHPAARIGVHLRASGLIAVDVDVADGKPGSETLARLEAKHGSLPRTNHQRSGRGGQHFIMRDPSPGPDGWTRTADSGGSIRGKLGPGIDLKCNGYIVLSPSGSYTWLAHDPTNVAPVPEAWVPLMRKPPEECHVRGDGIHAWQTTTRALDERDIDGLRTKLCDLGPRGAGNSTTFKAIKLVCHDYGQSVDDGARFLEEWNSSCGSPHSEHELARQIERVAAWSWDNDEPRGWLVGLETSRIRMTEMVRRRMRSGNMNIEAEARSTVRYGIDAADFLAMPDEGEDPWIVKGLLPAGMPVMIAGPPKSKKSWVELYLAVCIASGVPAFGRPTVRTRTLVIAREDTARETRRRIKLILAGLKLEPAHLGGWLRVDAKNPLYLDSDDDYQALTESIEDFKPGLVFIDSLSRIHLCEENSRSEMAIVTNRWSDLCKAHNVTICILHHVVKSDTGGSLIQRIRGTGDLGALIRLAIGVERVSDDVSKIEVDGNLADMADLFRVKSSDQFSGAERTAITIEVEKSTKSAELADGLSSPEVGIIADYLFRNGCSNMKQLRTAAGGARRAEPALKLMHEKGLVEDHYQGRKHSGTQLTERGKDFAAGRTPAGPPAEVPKRYSKPGLPGLRGVQGVQGGQGGTSASATN